MTLTLVNDVPNATQTTEAANGIFALVTFLPAVISVLCIVPLLFYDLTEGKSKQIRKDLEERTTE